MSSNLQFTLNGKAQQITTDARRTLLDVLREDLGLSGTKYGCGEGQCRACTVLLDGNPVQSCLTPAAAANGRTIETIEGLASEGELHPVQQAFLDEGALQCGYCVPGMIMTTVALLKRTPHPSEARIVEALNGNLCRCCGYGNILKAVRRAASQEAK
jgi:aerobic-type carbon monoxide dehydrogenase small subunit (CoxS/CutS family)